MLIFSEKQETSITIKVKQLTLVPKITSFTEESDRSLAQSLPILLDLVKAQPLSGAAEMTRAIRKRLKYGQTPMELVRALTLLELVVLNADVSIGSVVARDDKLLHVLKNIIANTKHNGSGQQYDYLVRASAIALARGWKHELGEMNEYKYLAGLYNYIPSSLSHTKDNSIAKFRSYSSSTDYALEDDELESRGGDPPCPSNGAIPIHDFQGKPL